MVPSNVGDLILLVTFSMRATCTEAPIAGYSVVPLAWSVTPSPGAPAQVFEGTMEQVFSAIREIDPNFREDFGLNNTDLVFPLPVPKEGEGAVEKRDTVNCNPNPNWHSAYLNGIQQDISYLRGVPGQPQRGPGPGSCGRVSCSYECAIWWCNDNPYTFSLPSFNNIADGAQLIVDTCTESDPYAGAYKFVRGQDFHSDNCNVIVRLDQDNC